MAFDFSKHIPENLAVKHDPITRAILISVSWCARFVFLYCLVRGSFSEPTSIELQLNYVGIETLDSNVENKWDYVTLIDIQKSKFESPETAIFFVLTLWEQAIKAASEASISSWLEDWFIDFEGSVLSNRRPPAALLPVGYRYESEPSDLPCSVEPIAWQHVVYVFMAPTVRFGVYYEILSHGYALESIVWEYFSPDISSKEKPPVGYWEDATIALVTATQELQCLAPGCFLEIIQPYWRNALKIATDEHTRKILQQCLSHLERLIA